MIDFNFNRFFKFVDKQKTTPTGISSADYFDLQSQFHESLKSFYGRDSENSDTIRHAVEGSIKLLDACALRDILQIARPKNALEIGSFLGFSLRWMLESTKEIGTVFTSVDPRVRHRIFDDIKSHLVEFNSRYSDRVRLVDAFLSDRNDEMFLHDYLNYQPVYTREDAISLLNKIQLINKPFGNFDFAFIDGDHSYQATVKNVSLVSQMMSAGGYIIVHDAISWTDVEPALVALSTIDGIDLVGVVGKDFFNWAQSHHALANNMHTLHSLCDGLGVIRIQPGLALRQADIDKLLIYQGQ